MGVGTATTIKSASLIFSGFGDRQMPASFEIPRRNIAGGVDVIFSTGNFLLAQIESDGGDCFAKGHGQGQPHVAEADNSDGRVADATL